MKSQKTNETGRVPDSEVAEMIGEIKPRHSTEKTLATFRALVETLNAKPLIQMAGYSGRPKLLAWIVAQPDLLLVDIRFMPRSRNPVWKQASLIAALGQYTGALVSGRYLHLPEFGNRNYHTGKAEDIVLDNPLVGLKRLELATLSFPKILLLCVCEEPALCHRSHVRKLLNEYGQACEELVSQEVGLVNQRLFL